MANPKIELRAELAAKSPASNSVPELVAEPASVPVSDQTTGLADRLWNWVLAKQGLHVDRRLAEAHTAADLALGLHAARLPSPYATAAARTTPDTDLTVLLGPRPHPQLVTVRCMRKTLHSLPPHVASVALAATRRYRLRDVETAVRNAGIAGARRDASRRWLVDQVSTGTSYPRELETAGTADRWTIPEVRLALKWCWEAGLVTYQNHSSSWHREKRAFSLTAHTHPDLKQNLDPEASTDELIKLYFERYGPATVKDASWWSGLGRQRVLAALNELDTHILRLPWADSPFYMLRSDYENLHSENMEAGFTESITGLNFLAHEDVALKAYHESRSRYLGDLNPSLVFNQIGEVLPTILWNGRVIGRWRWDHTTHNIIYRHFAHTPSSATMRSETRRLADQLRDRLLTGYQRTR